MYIVYLLLRFVKKIDVNLTGGRNDTFYTQVSASTTFLDISIMIYTFEKSPDYLF